MIDAAERKVEKPNITGDRVNIVILIFLYVLQGGTAGLTVAFPIILQNRGVSYADQAEFSMAGYPFCFKLLWAPIVDCMYSRKFGRRKSWLIPMQYAMGFLLWGLSVYLNDWMGGGDSLQKPKVRVLAAIFFMSTFLNAVQDVALDGWSLTMLQRRNLGYAGTCQNIGSQAGMLSVYSSLILLDSKEFCNIFRATPQDHGYISLADYIFYWSMLLILSTTLVFMFKKDNSLEVIGDEDDASKLGLKESYLQLWKILQLRPVITLCLVLLTCRVGFGPASGVAPLKVIEAGVTRDNYVLFTTVALPVQMVLSVVLRRWLTGPQTMRTFILTYILKLIAGVLLAVVLFSSGYVKKENNMLPSWLYGLLLFVFNLRNIIKYLMLLSMGTFLCRVSDARYGGIYMTIWGSVINVGANWPITLCLWCVDLLTMESHDQGEIRVKFDGFYAETILFTVLGILWLCWGKKAVYELERLETSAWVVEEKNKVFVNEEILPVLS